LAAASRALEIDPSMGEAYIGLGMYYSCQFDYEKSVENYHRAIELAPNYSLGRVLNGSNLVGIGRFDEGIRELEIAERLDPISPLVKTLSAWAFYQSRQFETTYRKKERKSSPSTRATDRAGSKSAILRLSSDSSKRRWKPVKNRSKC
jgi:Tfp pilus assembly protein PilF